MERRADRMTLAMLDAMIASGAQAMVANVTTRLSCTEVRAIPCR